MLSTFQLAPTSISGRASEVRILAGSLMTLLNLAESELERSPDAAKATIARASSMLRVEIDREMPQTQGRGADRPLLPWQARRVREYIDSNLGKRILIADLSDIARRSPAHFARSFKQTFGQSPHDYLVRRRIERATLLMRTSEESLCDIAVMCGFTDQAHLCRQFRQRVGQSPGAWRRERCEPESQATVRLTAAPCSPEIRTPTAHRTSGPRHGLAAARNGYSQVSKTSG
jgi:AraC family transcriptional regulator